jgi:A/G-specific adenine glycosylase
MLQQTQAARVAPAFRSFVRRFPSVRALAAAPRADVIREWSGLGYNRRAVALSDAARAIVAEHGGRVPADLEALRALPGVGPYTAAAVASMAFGVAVPAVDTNVRRVVSRARLGDERADEGAVRREAERWIDRRDPGTWNQAVMDLGREVCRPVPRCDRCPLRRGCRFRGRVPTRKPRRTSGFEGSSRQLRGRIVAALRDRDEVDLGSLADAVGVPLPTAAALVAGLVRDGLVEFTSGAGIGRSGSRVRLPG